MRLIQGYLPRASQLKESPNYLPPFIDPQEWTLEAATFGQNDYIGEPRSAVVHLEHRLGAKRIRVWFRYFGR